MMFMTPMPPTSSEMAAMPASSTVSVLSTELAVSSIWVWEVMVKSASAGLVMPCRASNSSVASVSAAPMVDWELASR